MSKTRYYNPFDSSEEYLRTSQNPSVRTAAGTGSTNNSVSEGSVSGSAADAADSPTVRESSGSYSDSAESLELHDDSVYSKAEAVIGEYTPPASNTSAYSGVPLKDIIPDATIEQIDLSGPSELQFTDVSSEAIPTSAVSTGTGRAVSVSGSRSNAKQPDTKSNSGGGRSEQVHKKRSGNPLSFLSGVALDDLILIGVIVLLFMEEQEKRDMPLIITLAFLLIIELIDDGKFGFLSA